MNRREVFAEFHVPPSQQRSPIPSWMTRYWKPSTFLDVLVTHQQHQPERGSATIQDWRRIRLQAAKQQALDAAARIYQKKLRTQMENKRRQQNLEQRRKFASTLVGQLQEKISQRRERNIVYKRVIRRRIIRTIVAKAPPPPPPPPPQPPSPPIEDSDELSVDEHLDSEDDQIVGDEEALDESDESFELVVAPATVQDDDDESLGEVEGEINDASDESFVVGDDDDGDESMEEEIVEETERSYEEETDGSYVEETERSFVEEDFIDDENEEWFDEEPVIPLPLVNQELLSLPEHVDDERQELQEEWQYLTEKRNEEGLTEEEEVDLRRIEDALFPKNGEAGHVLQSKVKEHEESVFDHEVGYRPQSLLALVNMAKIELRPPPPKDHKEKFVPVVQDAASIGRLMRLHEFTIEAQGKRNVADFNTKTTDSSYAVWMSNRAQRGQHRKPVTRTTRSNAIVMVYEAAAVGKLRSRRNLDPDGLSKSNHSHEIDIDDLGDDRHDGAKVFRTEHLIDRRVDWDRRRKSDDWTTTDDDTEFDELDDVILPIEVQPPFKPKQTQKSPQEIREELARGVAEGFWNRQYRLERPGAPLQVTEGCFCKYCPTASAWQTFAYQKRWAEERLPQDVSTTEDPEAHGYLSRLYLPEEEIQKEIPRDIPDEVGNLEFTVNDEDSTTASDLASTDITCLMVENSELINDNNDEVNPYPEEDATLEADAVPGGAPEGTEPALETPLGGYAGSSGDIEIPEVLNDVMPMISDRTATAEAVVTLDQTRDADAPDPVLKKEAHEKKTVSPTGANSVPLSEQETSLSEDKPRRFRPLKWLSNRVLPRRSSVQKRATERMSFTVSGRRSKRMSVEKPATTSTPSSVPAEDDSVIWTVEGENRVEVERQAESTTKHSMAQASAASVVGPIVVSSVDRNVVNAYTDEIGATAMQDSVDSTRDVNVTPRESIRDRLSRLSKLQERKELSTQELRQVEWTPTEKDEIPEKTMADSDAKAPELTPEEIDPRTSEESEVNTSDILSFPHAQAAMVLPDKREIAMKRTGAVRETLLAPENGQDAMFAFESSVSDNTKDEGESHIRCETDGIEVESQAESTTKHPKVQVGAASDVVLIERNVESAYADETGAAGIQDSVDATEDVNVALRESIRLSLLTTLEELKEISTHVMDPVECIPTEISTSDETPEKTIADTKCKTREPTVEETDHLAPTTEVSTAAVETFAQVALAQVPPEGNDTPVETTEMVTGTTLDSESSNGIKGAVDTPVSESTYGTMGTAMPLIEARPRNQLIVHDATVPEGTNVVCVVGTNDTVPSAPPRASHFLKRRKSNGILARMCAGTPSPSVTFQSTRSPVAPAQDSEAAILSITVSSLPGVVLSGPIKVLDGIPVTNITGQSITDEEANSMVEAGPIMPIESIQR